MGHPAWGRESDTSSILEARLQWPPVTQIRETASTTLKFIEAVKRAAQDKVLVAVLTGHTHKNAVVPIPCPDGATVGCRTAAKQFTTRANGEGWSRLVQLRFVPPLPSPVDHRHEIMRMHRTPEAAKPVAAPAALRSQQPSPRKSSNVLPAWAAQAGLLCFFGLVILTALTGFSQRFLMELFGGKRGTWTYCGSYREEHCLAKEELYPGGKTVSKLGFVKEIPAMSEVPTYGTLEADYGKVSKYGTLDADYDEVLL